MSLGAIFWFCLVALVPLGCFSPLIALRFGRRRAGLGFGLHLRNELDRYAKMMVPVCGLFVVGLSLSFLSVVFTLLLTVAGLLLIGGAVWGWSIAFRLLGSVERCRREWLNLCTRCGYSLRGNTTGVCPECGAAVSEPIRTG